MAVKAENHPRKAELCGQSLGPLQNCIHGRLLIFQGFKEAHLNGRKPRMIQQHGPGRRFVGLESQQRLHPAGTGKGITPVEKITGGMVQVIPIGGNVFVHRVIKVYEGLFFPVGLHRRQWHVPSDM